MGDLRSQAPLSARDGDLEKSEVKKNPKHSLFVKVNPVMSHIASHSVHSTVLTPDHLKQSETSEFTTQLIKTQNYTPLGSSAGKAPRVKLQGPNFIIPGPQT